MVLEQLFKLMAEKKASDLMLSPGAPVTLKIQAVMVQVNQSQVLSEENVLNMLVSVLTQEQVIELQTTHDLNIGLVRQGIGSFRLSAFKQKNGYSAVFRFISAYAPSFESLNLPSTMKGISLVQRGLVLVCGATGSGKTSTIAAMLEERNLSKAGYILTVEDPIEYQFVSKKAIFNQREIGTDVASVEVALRNGLRQAPDVIYIGEIRDQATMTAAITYALSGHLVLTTLHANNSYHALSRIVSMFPSDNRAALLSDLSSCVRYIVSQRLVKSSAGGRVPALEVMTNTQLTAELIEQGKLIELREAIENSMSLEAQTFEQGLMNLVNSGKISKEEALNAADSPNNLLWLLNNQGKSKKTEKADDAPIDRSVTGAQYKEFNFG